MHCDLSLSLSFFFCLFRQLFVESCREFKQVVVHAREGAMKALGFAKTLMKDLEIAAEFGIRGSPSELLQVLKSSDHVQVQPKLNEIVY